MMNDSLYDFHWLDRFEYRRDQLMDEARRERMKADILRRARQQQDAHGLRHSVAPVMSALSAWLQRWLGPTSIEQPCAVDDCLESSLT